VRASFSPIPASARRRTIGAIYKQLAKVLHPDLEPDPEKRGEKLALMQQLTAAYRNEDLPSLLRLELEWLHREEGDLDRLTEEELKIYNAVLREQAGERQAGVRPLQLGSRGHALFPQHPDPGAERPECCRLGG
jgi:curved DNA-binding protein CbpA